MQMMWKVFYWQRYDHLESFEVLVVENQEINSLIHSTDIANYPFLFLLHNTIELLSQQVLPTLACPSRTGLLTFQRVNVFISEKKL